MSETTLVNFRMETTLKRDMEETCHELGMNMTTAFTIFAKKVAREHRIPFEVSADPFYSDANLARLREIRADAEAGRRMTAHELIDD
ncbi:MAG: type II toxin-antitoxin system RelB/DinJ family antitoxin [Bifidobacteriaceae bacterium]|jgi:DNA-damage-inducible protein J|nr:type II toxin-antitoxin system RelB/DinJ family antitoxin [Bifidobacteriaceae bacterium]